MKKFKKKIENTFQLVFFTLVILIFRVKGFATPLNPINEATTGVKISWGDNYTASWDGHLNVTGIRIVHIEPFSFEGNQDRFFFNELRWTSKVKRYPWQYRMYNKRQYNPIYQEVFDAWEKARNASSADGLYIWLDDVESKAEINVHFLEKTISFSIIELFCKHKLKWQIPEKGTITAELLIPYLKITDGKMFSKVEHVSKHGEKNEAPAMTVDSSGVKWVSWVRFNESEDENIYVVSVTGNQVGLPEQISSNKTLNFEPRMTCDKNGRIWVCWTAQNRRYYSIRGKFRTGANWSEEQVISITPGKNFHPSIARDQAGGVWVAWETFRERSYVIVARYFDGKNWGNEIIVSDTGISSHLPAVTVDSKDRCWVTWEGTSDGDYEIYLRFVKKDGLGEIVQLTNTIESETRPAVAVDARNRLWITYQEVILEPENFKPKPQKKVENRRYIMVKCYDVHTGKIYAPYSAILNGNPGQITQLDRTKFSSILVDRSGRPWIFFRKLTNRNVWNVTALCYAGREWNVPLCVSGDWGGTKYPLSPAIDNNNQVWVSWETYDRIEGIINEDLKGPSNILIAKCNLPEMLTGEPVLKFIGSASGVIDKENQETPPFPHRTIKYNNETYTLYFGNLHKHSEVSQCIRSRNGWLEDHFSFARDVRMIDFLMIADHSEHTDYYEWHRLNRAAMLYNHKQDFIGFPGYEWTSEGFVPGESYGHYNAVFLIPDGEFIPLKYLLYSTRQPYQPDQVWDYLRDFKKNGKDVITIPHHPGRLTAVLDYRFYDPEFVPVIEIAQSRGSYEYHRPHDYAEPAVNDVVKQGHFVQDGLARGYEYGFVASGDHFGNQLAAVYAKNLSREAIFDAIKERRCYATFGEKIFVDFRVNGVLMGGNLELSSHDAPRIIDVHVIGDNIIESIDIIKNNVDIVHHPVGKKEVIFNYTDSEPVYDELNYYYIRVNQDKFEKAWASPVWFSVSE